MPAVHVVVPDGFDDPDQPSGGNLYDRHLIDGLVAAGWEVRTHAVPGTWPSADATALAALERTLGDIAVGSLVVIDGLIASAAPLVLVPATGRLAVVVLMHMPLATEAEQAVITAARGVIATSGWTRNRLLALYAVRPDAVEVAVPGVAAYDLARGTATGTRLLCVAAVTPNKGHDVLFRALGRLDSASWTCRCVGPLDRDASFVARLRRQAETDAIASRIVLTGPLAGDDLATAYRDADVLVHPSRAETYGMVVAEALACGLPVIATEVGGLPEALGSTPSGLPGLLVPPDDDAALARAVQSWLQDAGLRDRLRAAARSRRGTLPPWSTTIERIARFLRVLG